MCVRDGKECICIQCGGLSHGVNAGVPVAQALAGHGAHNSNDTDYMKAMAESNEEDRKSHRCLRRKMFER